MLLATLHLLESVGYETTDVVGYTAMVLSALLVFFGIRSWRDKGGGALTFGRGLGASMISGAILRKRA